MQLKERIKEFITSDLNGQPALQLGYDEDLLISGLVDSLGVVRLIVFLEDETGVSIPPGEITIENFGTIDAMTTYLDTKTH